MKQPIILTKRGEKLMLVTFWVLTLLLISFADVLAGLLNG